MKFIFCHLSIQYLRRIVHIISNKFVINFKQFIATSHKRYCVLKLSLYIYGGFSKKVGCKKKFSNFFHTLFSACILMYYMNELNRLSMIRSRHIASVAFPTSNCSASSTAINFDNDLFLILAVVFYKIIINITPNSSNTAATIYRMIATIL